MVGDETGSCVVHGACSYVRCRVISVACKYRPSPRLTPCPAVPPPGACSAFRSLLSLLALRGCDLLLLRENVHLLTRFFTLSILHAHAVVTFQAPLFAPRQSQRCPGHARYHRARSPLAFPRTPRSLSVPFCPEDLR